MRPRTRIAREAQRERRQRQQGGDQRELARLDPEVEASERERNLARRYAERAERARKTESVQQAEAKRQRDRSPRNADAIGGGVGAARARGRASRRASSRPLPLAQRGDSVAQRGVLAFGDAGVTHHFEIGGSPRDPLP